MLRPDLATLRLVPWHEGTALVLCDVAVGRRRAGRRRRRARSCAGSSTGSPSAGSSPDVGTELEFIVFNDTYEEAWEQGYRGLHAGQPVQRRLLAHSAPPGSSRCCAASATA